MERDVNRRRMAMMCAGLTAITLIIYLPVVGHKLIGFDDQEYVAQNLHVQQGLCADSIKWAFATSDAANWHPLTWLSHMLDVQLFQMEPGLHHLTSLIIHILNTMLVFLVLHRMTAALRRSALVAALFAIHPLHVESVAWVAERKDVLSTFFFLLTLGAYTVYAQRCRPENKPGKKERKAATTNTRRPLIPYLCALVFFALGLMSKPMLVTVPFLLLLLDYWPLARFESPRPSGLAWRIVVEKIPFLVLALGSCIVTFAVQRGAVAHLHDFPLSGRLINAVTSYLTYLSKTVWPVGLSVFYPHPAIANSGAYVWPAWQAVAAASVLAGVSWLAVVWRKSQPWFAMGWFWYLGTLVPVIGLVQVGSQAMADRYTYIPLLGIFVIFAWGLESCFIRPGTSNPNSIKQHALPPFASVPVALAVIALSMCCIVTRKQLSYWQDDFSLFTRSLALNERNAPAHAILGTAYGKIGKYGLALVHAKAATQVDPTYSGGWHTLGDVYDSMGLQEEAIPCFQAAIQRSPNLVWSWFRLACVYGAMGKVAEAEDSYKKTLVLEPRLIRAYNNLGTLYFMAGRTDEGLKEFAEAIRLDPKAPSAHYNYGTGLERVGRLPEATQQFSEAVRLKPDYVEALASLGSILTRQGRVAEGADAFGQIAKYRPDDAEVRLRYGGALLIAGKASDAAAAFAAALRLDPDLATKTMQAGAKCLEQKQTEEAMRDFTKVTWLQPNNVQAHYFLGLILLSLGQFDSAISHFDDVLRLAPGGQAHENLARALARRGRLNEAADHYQKAIELEPELIGALNDLAWIRATAPDGSLRNGVQAVQLAEKACQLAGKDDPILLGTLAAAYAEAARYPDAIRTTEKVRDLAQSAGDKAGADKASARLALYLENKPFRQ